MNLLLISPPVSPFQFLPRAVITAAVLLCVYSAARADVRLPGVLSDHAVLQREAPVEVWGWAEVGEEVTVNFGGQSQTAKTDKDGTWSVKLAAMPANAAPQELIVIGRNVIKVNDVLVGDVWLCSGQSNMAFGLGGALDALSDMKGADFPAIRFMNYWEHFAAEKQGDIATHWHRVTPAEAGNCMAVAFYFARKIYTETKVPIGLLAAAVGGTEIECWMPPEAFRDFPACAEIGKRLDNAVDTYQKAVPAAVDAMEKWLPIARHALAERKPVPPPPRFPLHPNEDRGGQWVRIQSLYNGMIHPLTRFAIKGAIWYQGENNGDEDQSYFEKKRALIESWRKLWGSEFPFYFVQLANYQKASDVPSGDDGQARWQRCRMAQLRCLRIPKTGMAVSIDVGEANDIHPRNKFDVGERLALWALAKDYGKNDLVCSGPLFRAMKIDGSKIRVSFDSVGGGLMVGKKEGRKPTIEDKAGKLNRFAIAGADKKWQWADAVFDGNTVVVSSPNIVNPVAVRYAYSINPEGCNLYNTNGLPASPFRTDDW